MCGRSSSSSNIDPLFGQVHSVVSLALYLCTKRKFYLNQNDRADNNERNMAGSCTEDQETLILVGILYHIPVPYTLLALDQIHQLELLEEPK